jgi:hypothetical protein
MSERGRSDRYQPSVCWASMDQGCDGATCCGDGDGERKTTSVRNNIACSAWLCEVIVGLHGLKKNLDVEFIYDKALQSSIACKYAVGDSIGSSSVALKSQRCLRVKRLG